MDEIREQHMFEEEDVAERVVSSDDRAMLRDEVNPTLDTAHRKTTDPEAKTNCREFIEQHLFRIADQFVCNLAFISKVD